MLDRRFSESVTTTAQPSADSTSAGSVEHHSSAIPHLCRSRSRSLTQLDACRRRNPRLESHLPAQARRAGGAEEVAAAPSLHRPLGRRPHERSRNQSRAHRPRPEGGGLGRRRGQPHPARVPDHARPHRRPGRRGKPLTADYVLVYRNPSWPWSRPRPGTSR